MSKVDVDELRSLYTLTDRLYRATGMADVFDAGLDAITECLGCDRASILLFDEDGVMRFKSARGLSDHYCTRLEGHTPWQKGELHPVPILVSDIEQTDEEDWVKKTIRDEGIRCLGFFPLTQAGRAIGKFMTYYPEPREFPQHEIDLAVTIARQVGFSVEREWAESLRRRVEEDLRHSEARFRLMSESAPVMIWMSDRNGACLHLNRMLRDVWGVTEQDFQAFDWRSTMHPEDADMITEVVSSAVAEQKAFSVKGRYLTVDGSFRIFLTTAKPNYSGSGDFLGMIGVNVDITEQERAAEHREFIFNELNHRVKNTLSLVQAIAHRTLKGARGATLAKEFEGRLASLAVAHNLLTEANWDKAPLRQLLSDALMTRSETSAKYRLSGPDVSLSPKQALAIAMAVHELNTNAVKYGALSAETGQVDLEWTIETRNTFEMIWSESGGPSVAVPEKRGFGTFMIERVLAHDLEGEVSLDFFPEGLRCSIRALLHRAEVA